MQHHLKAGRAVGIAGFDGVDDIHQNAAGGMTQIQAEGDDDQAGQREAPGDDDALMLRQHTERMAGDFIDNEPVRIGERIVVIPGPALLIEYLAFTRCHAG